MRTFFFEFAQFGQFRLHGHAELVRDAAQVQQVLRLVVAARVVRVLAAVRTAHGADFELFPLQKQTNKQTNIRKTK